MDEHVTTPPPPITVSPRRRLVRYGIAVLLAAAVVAWLVLGPDTQAAWDAVQAHLGAWQDWAERNPAPALLGFIAAYALATAMPLPVLTVMSLLAGALFGRWLGTAAASLAFTAGVTASFLVVRWVFRERVRRSGGRWLRRVERGVERDGAYYLLSLRLMPSLPFYLVNYLMAVTPIRTGTFALVSWVGVLPITFLYASVGTDLAAVASPAGLLSPRILGSLAALAVLPIVLRAAARRLRPASIPPIEPGAEV
jgi:uncharacterized membrane protein YdjX (TVP38/TMEM64 family)